MAHTNVRIIAVLACVCGGSWGMTGCGGDGAAEFGGEGTGGEMAASGGATGTAGSSGTGGAIGSGGGGASGTAGHANTGGNFGSGGMAATGGRPGTGGRSSTGGSTGSGGRSATGGTVASGGTSASGGASGTGGVNGAMCDQLAADYQKELSNAKSCSLGVMVKQCQISVAGGLGCGSNCKIYVQSAGKLSEIAMAWTNASCDSTLRACPAILCIQAQPGNCALSGTIMAPQCQQGPTTLP